MKPTAFYFYKTLHYILEYYIMIIDSKKLKECLKLLIEICDEYKSIYINNEIQNSNIVLSYNYFFHCLGLNRIQFPKKINKDKIMNDLYKQPENFINKYISNKNRKLSKLDRKFIKSKIISFIEFIDAVVNENFCFDIHINQDSCGKCELYIYNKLYSFILICESNFSKKDNNKYFYNYHIKSLRNKNIDKKYNVKVRKIQ